MDGEIRKQAWEQREGEQNEAYARFLVYRNLGVARSLDSAYCVALNRVKSRASGQWVKECSKYEWVMRASAWDVYVLTEIGQQVVVRYVNALDLAFQRIIESLANRKIKPRSWGAIIDSITTLGGFIPQETVRTVRQ